MQSFDKSSINKTDNSSAADLTVARKVHAAMIPEIFPVAEELEIRSLYIPCEHIGGDLFDIVQISDNIVAFWLSMSGCGYKLLWCPQQPRFDFPPI